MEEPTRPQFIPRELLQEGQLLKRAGLSTKLNTVPLCCNKPSTERMITAIAKRAVPSLVHAQPPSLSNWCGNESEPYVVQVKKCFPGHTLQHNA